MTWEKILKYDEGEVDKLTSEIQYALSRMNEELRYVNRLIDTRGESLIRGNPDHDVEDLFSFNLQDLEQYSETISRNSMRLYEIAMRIAEEENDVGE